MTTKDFNSSLEAFPEIASVFTDGFLALWVNKEEGVRLRAEIWLRRWLYAGQWTPRAEFLNVFDEASDAFREAFKREAQPWRRPRVDAASSFPLEKAPTVSGLTDDEAEIWNILWRRMREFACCDGMVALVSENEAVSVAFELSHQPGSATIRDANQSTLEAWSQAVNLLAADYTEHSLGATLRAVFPKTQTNLTGESLALAVLLARERKRAGRLPEFHPLEMLATGAFRAGRLKEVGGIKAKENLALRIGCTFFSPVLEDAGDNLLPAEGDWTEVLRQAGEHLRWPHPQHGAALGVRVIEECKTRLNKIARMEDSSNYRLEAAGIFRRLTRIENALVGRALKANCRQLMRIAASYARAEKFAAIDTQTEQLLSSYREKVMHGRQGYLKTLTKWLHDQPGGLQLVTGKVGQGKTALLTQILDAVPNDRLVFHHFFSVNSGQTATRPWANFSSQLGLFLAAVLGKGLGNSSEQVDDWLAELGSEHPERRLVIIIDAVDEADGVAHVLRRLPPNVHAIVSARVDGGEEKSYLEGWTELLRGRTPLSLDKLEIADLRTWLEANPRLKALAANNTFCSDLLAKTAGEPRYIEALLGSLADDLNPTGNWQQYVNDLPNDYQKFVAAQYTHLASAKDVNGCDIMTPERNTLLGLLCAAEDELTAQELGSILNLDAANITALLENLPPQMQRWVSSATIDNDSGQKRCTIQTEAMKAGLRSKIATSDYEAKLLRHCARWADLTAHFSPYALRHYSAHLAKAKKWAAAAEFITDPRYHAQTAHQLRDEVDLPLQVLRDTLQKAVDAGDWEGIATLMFARAKLHHLLLKLDPKEGEENSNDTQPDWPERAKKAGRLAAALDHFDRGRAGLMRLLKIRALLLAAPPDEQEIESARQELADQSFARLDGLEADVAAALLARVFEPGDVRLARVAEGLLDDESRSRLVGLLVGSSSALSSLEAARQVFETLRPSKLNATNRHFDKAATTLAVALAKAEKWEDAIGQALRLMPRQGTHTLIEIGGVAAKTGARDRFVSLEEAIHTLRGKCQSPNPTKLPHIEQKNRRLKYSAKDFVVCTANLARLHGVKGRSADGDENARKAAWLESRELAFKIPPEQRCRALCSLILEMLKADCARMFAAENSGAEENKLSLGSLWGAAEDAWEDMRDHEKVAWKTTTHMLAMLLDTGLAIAHFAPREISGLERKLAAWKVLLEKRANLLSEEVRDEIWNDVAGKAEKAPNLDLDWACWAIRNLEDYQLAGRATARLVERLYQNHELPKDRATRKHVVVSDYHLDLQSVMLAEGMVSLDNEPDTSWIRLYIRSQPRAPIPTRPRQIGILWAELAVAHKGEAVRRDKFLAAAKSQLMQQGIRFQLDWIDAAWQAGCNVHARGALFETAQVLTEQIDQLKLYRATSLLAHEVGSPHAGPSQPELLEAVERLCALSSLQYTINPKLPQWQETWATAAELAATIPGFSARTQALAEVAETAAKQRRPHLAEEVLRDRYNEVLAELEKIGEGRVRHERETCMGEIMFGLLKSKLWSSARELKPSLLAAGTGKDNTGRPVLQGSAALHAIAWQCICDYEPIAARIYLEKIGHPDEKAKATRDMAVSLAHQGKWVSAVGLADEISRGEHRQTHLHRIARAVAESANLTPAKKEAAYRELLWPCSGTLDGALLTLAHILRHTPQAGRDVARALEWAERQQIVPKCPMM